MKTRIFYLSFLAVATTIISCEDDKEVSLIVPSSFTTTESAYPNQAGLNQRAYLYGYPVNYVVINNDVVFQNDIILRQEELTDQPTENTTTGRTRTGSKWPNKIVYYKIDPALPNPQRVYNAMAHWEANTSIRFIARTTQRGYVLFQNGSGCSSNVGYSGGLQYVSLSSGCTTGNTIHEIGHTIGLWHEHSRSDQSRFVTIHYENIASGAESNFYTYGGQGYDGFDYGSGMDFSSIMMYSPYEFSKNGQPTITKKDGTLYTAQRIALSPLDIATVQAMYP